MTTRRRPLFAAPAIEDDCLMRTNPRVLILENIDTFRIAAGASGAPRT